MAVTNHPNILLVGYGEMGRAMLRGWVRAGVPTKNLRVIDPVGKPLIKGINVLRNPKELDKAFKPDVVVFAVKPHQIDDTAPLYKGYKSVFLSVAAGKTIGSLAKALGSKAAIVRAMPNLPALISKGITVAVANRHVSKAQKERCSKMLRVLGKFHWIPKEKDMDAVTAVSGSGPAYLFHFMEAMQEAAKKTGLPEELAIALVEQTIFGSATLAKRSPDTVAKLRERVTSPNGTTHAALQKLMGSQQLEKLMTRAIQAAKKRSKELSKA